MGQASDHARGERFAAAFGPAAETAAQAAPGEWWRLKKSYLFADDDGRVARAYVFTRDAVELILEDETLFDPSYMDVDDLVDNGLPARLGLTEAEFRAKAAEAAL